MGERHAVARTRYIGRLAEGEIEGQRLRKEASETGKLLVRGALGAGPTPTGATTGATPSGAPAPSPLTAPAAGAPAPDATGLLKDTVVSEARGERYQPDITQRILDPEKYAEFIKGTAEFRIADALTRDAEALATRSGPLWDEMLNMVQLPIMEGAGAMARENAETLRRQMAKGGAARRSAFATIQQMREKDRSNSQKAVALSNARQQLMTYGHQFASQNLKLMNEWYTNLPFQQAYNTMMDNASQMFLESALPIMAQQTDKENAMKQQMRNEKSGKLGRIISGIAGAALIVAAPFTGGATLAPGVGMLAGALTQPAGQVGFMGARAGAGSRSLGVPQGGAGGPLTGITEAAEGMTGEELTALKELGGKALGGGQSLINKVLGTQFGRPTTGGAGGRTATGNLIFAEPQTGS